MFSRKTQFFCEKFVICKLRYHCDTFTYVVLSLMKYQEKQPRDLKPEIAFELLLQQKPASEDSSCMRISIGHTKLARSYNMLRGMDPHITTDEMCRSLKNISWIVGKNSLHLLENAITA